ncbi:MAG TPA: TetR family transcriptional regulator [Solirubrobacteraceae bacterium]|nr:TetR family transcriptional regulator [Solirubrobacteraceae bacterium]
MPGRSGRRPGDSGTREAIRAAAIEQFSERGYDRPSMRSIAQQAGVDPALVSHYFGSKHALFVDVVELPFDPAQVIPTLLGDGDRAQIGARVAAFLLGVLEQPVGRQRITGLVRAAASEPEAARMVRDLLTREIFARVAGELQVEDATLRANLVASQVVGLVMARYIVGLEPLASMPAADVAAAVAPTLQRYLTEPLAPGDRGPPPAV